MRLTRKDATAHPIYDLTPSQQHGEGGPSLSQLKWRIYWHLNGWRGRLVNGGLANGNNLLIREKLYNKVQASPSRFNVSAI